eukprot:COSAG01_NODE_17469_length_1149_cov_1.476190_1_plen_32_part_10
MYNYYCEFASKVRMDSWAELRMDTVRQVAAAS